MIPSFIIYLWCRDPLWSSILCIVYRMSIFAMYEWREHVHIGMHSGKCLKMTGRRLRDVDYEMAHPITLHTSIIFPPIWYSTLWNEYRKLTIICLLNDDCVSITCILHESCRSIDGIDQSENSTWGEKMRRGKRGGGEGGTDQQWTW